MGSERLVGTLALRVAWFSMEIRWQKLDGVKEAGRFPFRDGTIEITFAECYLEEDARGQISPDAKHPIQGQIEYVLGKQI